ncbi:4-hydroxy-tetrahydrodipicolinate reductase [Lawsonia intracellularis]|uniref:4-hydroxy-tetrahydrodipicolinate reductase n=1 Tax=Lawsonia intracellularis (strain PHE/MN1-00) TaxID=363253 RepID=DAPB_LAWIP|nr:4-hydroxy-tetrahydrodipicolinate reductase [Lawsonia intracellularis]Q1MRS7.1 RecName: Full=4-hydroxy-tetrahydrodipicolinate reductase; Short=HTPA reductase [Lawsonia intracellularis PHE/MN1-00]AGC49652.1 dihydrodipicolinate reductase [Lawsonia intracellularis N343]KAA0205158.1 4-hydroxy-tetrahydrodipicolinate reductase [Lawsonia intracellularis]MBZ3892314.1 4-hydroxy-tetrahydrodipicolinate reductase [Lawsonia intracellularis]OMQ05985.1 4-hydroxy-tetrahydrodipicolinate reductase [Lawsonia i
MDLSIIVIGASGRMGKTIIQVAQEQGIIIDAVIDRPTRLTSLASYNIASDSEPDKIFSRYPQAVVIDFTTPETSISMAQVAQKYGNPIIIGTTGFTLEQFDTLETLAKTSRIFWSPNMSIGINVLLKTLPQMAQILGNEYNIEIVEVHHNKKKDAPSGTAMRIAETLSTSRHWDLEKVACYNREGIVGERPQEQIGIQTIRGGDVVGVHTIYFIGPGERIEITHQADSRKNFAQGALKAAEWIIKQKAGRLYTMMDII